MMKNKARIESILTGSQRRKVASLIQSPEDSGPASGEILGILKQMKETFETDLAGAQKDEQTSQKAYEDLKAAKESEIAAGRDQVETKSQELATADEKLQNDKKDTVDTSAGKDADSDFLGNLKEKCAQVSKEYEERLKTRQMEMAAVSKAMGVLNSDDAKDLTSSSLGLTQASLLQTQSMKNLKSKVRARASKVLRDIALKHNNPHLMTLALRVRLDAFTKVLKAIDDQIGALTKESEDEIKHKDFCVESFNENEKMTNEKERVKTDLNELIEDLSMQIDDLSKAIATLKAEVGELQVQMKRASEDRELQVQMKRASE